ncbi:MAG: DUF2309 domain-containing protein [Betaproteobacteria bacterium HGW-Betaproteobacteria-12]|nr:MAG: DUF2309 domain-containing protein [Betaproteobacteria bacterium HGW-Betaproteobacteria-12]
MTHVLPAQAPIRDFVHHNTLHGFQHLPFAAALAAAQQLSGATTYWPEARFRECFAAGRISRDDLAAALDEVGVDGLDAPVLRGLNRRDILLASLLVADAASGPAHTGWLERERCLASDPYVMAARAATAGWPRPAAGDWQEAALGRWQQLCAGVGSARTLRALLEYLSGEDVLEKVRAILQRHLAAHLDLGVAAWRNPQRAQGFFAAWRASAGLDMYWELDELPNVRDEIAHLIDDPLAVLFEELSRLLPDERLWPGYLQRLSLELPGWSGMFLWRDRHPAGGDGTPVQMLDYLAVRVLLERLLCEDLIGRLTGAPMTFAELQAHYAANPAEFYVRDALRRNALPEALQHQVAHRLGAGPAGSAEGWPALAAAIAASAIAEAGEAGRLAALGRQLGLLPDDLAGLSVSQAQQLLDTAAALSPLQRGQVWLQAYERHYREQLFAALAANRGRRREPASPSAQVICCMDDREEGTRRHLEEIAPDIVTYGAAGFFGVAMYWQGVDDAQRSALCPIVVTPRHLVREVAAAGTAGDLGRHTRRRERRLRWRQRLYQATRRSPLAGPALTALAAAPALLALGAATLAPGWFGETLRRWRQQHDGRVASALALSAGSPLADGVQAGFNDDEQVERVAAFLRLIGLSENFAPLVLLLGHGSASENNPHFSAYDCGACSGRHGGPNARVFAAMANRPAVRAGLAAQGLRIPESTWFLAAEHNTCDDGIEWYDLEQVPPPLLPALDTLLAQLGEACRAHAAERCRRLVSAPRRASPWIGRQHVVARASDISQARPELGHATNAAAFIGRRQISRGLFLDRRVFLISYDPLLDADGAIVEGILLAAGPVGAGIALEYYFSSVDNERFGCGSKITHNITGLFGVMEGADSDLRTGLPWQMVEIHEPMRLLVVVEQTPAMLEAIVARQPALQELVGNAWIILASCDPDSGVLQHYCPRRGWQAWAGRAVLPQVGRSADWFAGESGPLDPALLLGGGA